MLFHVLTIVLVILKSFQIGEIATWSWWIIFSPSIIAFSIVIFFLLVALVLAILKS